MLTRGLGLLSSRILSPSRSGVQLLKGCSTMPELTRDRYPEVRRGPYTELNDKHIGHFRQLLGDTQVITEEAECLGYNVDWIKNTRGSSRCVLKPRSTEEVSSVLSYCNAHKIAICPQGGNTGLEGGSVPIFDEVVLSTQLMNNVISVDETSGVLVCQAGCNLEALEKQLEEKNLIMPLDLGSKFNCRIGGNISTNAGGLRLLRYGNLHGNVLGLEVVKADGEILDCLNVLKKDNTGYHLKHLFIGSEGTLGIVTKVAIQCPPKPKSINTALVALDSFEKVLVAFQKAKMRLGEIIASCEMMDAKSLAVVTDHLKVKNPLGKFPFYMIIECQGSNGKHDEEKMKAFLEEIMLDQTVLDGTFTNNLEQSKHIWQLRRRIVEGLMHDGYVLKYDISFPLKDFYSIVPYLEAKIGKEVIRCCGYGHFADGNIHLNISIKEYNEEIVKKIEPYVFEYISQLKGSVSAEHGMGFKKPKYMSYSKSPSAIALMKQIKTMMDPNGILNPYKVLPQ